MVAETLHGTIELSYAPTRTERGEVLGAVLRTPVLRPHARVEQQRRDERRRLRMIFLQVPGAIWTIDKDLRVTWAAGRLAESAGLSLPHVIGATITELFGSVNPADPFVAHHRAALAGEKTCFRYERRGAFYQVRLEPLTDRNGQSIGAIGVAVDVTERQQTEELLAASERRLSEAQRVAHLGTWEWDLAQKKVTWSDELYRIYGVGTGEFPGTYEGFLALVHEDDRERSRSTVFTALSTGTPFAYDHRIVRPDGGVRMLHTVGDVVTDRHGRVARLVGVCWDVTERWQATEQLERSLSLSRATLEATADGLLVVDVEGKVVAFNQRFLSLWQIPASLAQVGEDQALLDHVVNQLDEPEVFMRRVRELYADPDADSVDVLNFADGRVFERFSLPQRIGARTVGRVWSFRDVTERERLLRRALFLADASRLLASLDVEQALESLAHLSVPLMGDACAIDLLADEGGPRRLLSVARQPSLPINSELVRAVLAGHSSLYVVADRPHLSVPLKVHGTLLGAITFASGSGRRYVQSDLHLAEELAQRAALAIDNSRLYRRAQDALQAREEVLSIAAHEIRGPITSLHLAVQSLRRGVLPAAALDRTFGIIEREDMRLARLVDELLDVGRIQAGGLNFDFERFDLAEVVRDVATRLAPDLARSRSSLSVTTDGPMTGEWDRSRLEQVVENLLSNAIKFGLGRPIQVSAISDGHSVHVKIVDQGIGIAPTMQERIFEPFERAVSTRHYGGLGLGLYIVRNIVNGLGGTVRIESDRDAGAAFIVELPQSRPT